MTEERRTRTKDRFVGEILGLGTTEGTRVVVGRWATSPYGRFADVMVERADGHRILLAPTRAIAEYVAGTYSFDEILVVPVVVDRHDQQLGVSAGPLSVTARIGRRTTIGWVLHALPESITARTWFSRVSDPIARIVLPGVRTRGSAGGGSDEFYGAHDVHAIASVAASWDGSDLGTMARVDPPPRFGFGSTPRTPALTRLTTTVVSTGTSATTPGTDTAPDSPAVVRPR